MTHREAHCLVRFGCWVPPGPQHPRTSTGRCWHGTASTRRLHAGRTEGRSGRQPAGVGRRRRCRSRRRRRRPGRAPCAVHTLSSPALQGLTGVVEFALDGNPGRQDGSRG